MEQAMQQGRRANLDDVFSTDLFEREDQLAPVAGLRNALLVGAGIWALIIWSVFRFII
jgi:hypothetical protein